VYTAYNFKAASLVLVPKHVEGAVAFLETNCFCKELAGGMLGPGPAEVCGSNLGPLPITAFPAVFV